MNLIETITVSSSTSSLVFSNIPQTYTDLVLICSIRGTLGVYREDMGLRLNGDTGSNYLARAIRMFEGSFQAVGGTSGTYLGTFSVPSNTLANNFGNSIIQIPNYKRSTAKTITINSTMANSSNADSNFVAGRWSGTAAVSSITVFSANGVSLATGSTVSLYGISAGASGTATIS